ncbi:MAG: tripartite tricarboxylate transporter TctB family protein [Synergistaceae bacterium]|nr:tripartite tricarboxylate transporter TctB family protein [Synergistaceae bacterium]
MQQMLKEWLKIRNMHLFFPYLIGSICAVLFVIILIQRAIKCKKEGTPFINFKGYHFFKPGYDKVKLWGSVILFILYIITLPILHFAWTSVIFIFLFNVLFEMKPGRPFEFKSVVISAVIALASSWGVWYLFFRVFNITLP